MKQKKIIAAVAIAVIILACIGINLLDLFHKHSFSEWETRTSASCESAEIEARRCECGEEETREGDPATGHTFVAISAESLMETPMEGMVVTVEDLKVTGICQCGANVAITEGIELEGAALVLGENTVTVSYGALSATLTVRAEKLNMVIGAVVSDDTYVSSGSKDKENSTKKDMNTKSDSYRIYFRANISEILSNELFAANKDNAKVQLSLAITDGSVTEETVFTLKAYDPTLPESDTDFSKLTWNSVDNKEDNQGAYTKLHWNNGTEILSSGVGHDIAAGDGRIVVTLAYSRIADFVDKDGNILFSLATKNGDLKVGALENEDETKRPVLQVILKRDSYSEKGIFFSSSAEDGGDGSLEKPYNSLAVLSTLEIPADTYIYLERGSQFYGSLVLSGISGSKYAPVVVTAYGEGDMPKIDGSDLTGSGILHIENCSNLIVEELELYDSATAEGDRRGVLITCDNNLGSQEVVTYENIILRNLYIHDIHGYLDAENSGMALWSKKTGGIQLWSNDGLGRVDGLTITDCRITDVSNAGIATWYRMDGASADKISPYTKDFSDYAHLNVDISDNEISYIGKNAIFVRHLYGGVIEGNVIHDTAISCVSGNTIVTSYVDGTVIQYNEGYRNLAQERTSDGKLQDGCMLDADLASKDTLWQYNYSHDNAFGLFINCTRNDKECQDEVTVRYNLSVNDHGKQGIIYINYPTDGIYVYNNTIVTDYDTEYIIQSNSDRRSFFYNNLIYNRSANAKFAVDETCRMKASHNLIYNEYGSSIEGMAFFESINKDGIYGEDPLFAGHLQEDSIPGIEHLHGYQVDDNSPALGAGKSMDADADFFGNDYRESIGFYCGH